MSIEEEKSSKEKEWLSCRDVLWYLVFCGFALNYMLRTNLSLAIVAMVEPKTKAVAIAQCSEKAQLNSVHSNLWINASLNTDITEHSVGNTTTAPLEPPTTPLNHTSPNRTRYFDRFPWNEYEQGLALGGYYWLYWAVQMPGDVLARRWGTKFVFGWANFSNALIGFLIPAAAHCHLYVLVFLRILQGLTAGVVWSGMHNMAAKWIPPNEMNKFISSYIGGSVGSALTFPLSALIIDWFGWPSVFYVTSTFGVVWYAAWYYLVYDTPQEHPRISKAEKKYILESLGDSVNHSRSQVVPWKAILTSGHVWLVTIVSWGSSWGLHTLNSEAPSYFNYIHGWSISVAGLLSAVPHVARMLFAYFSSICADWILRTNKMSKTNLRKCAYIICNGVQSLLLLGLAYSGCHSTLAIVFMVTAMAASGALSSGPFASCIDLSPNYGGLILGISNMFTATAGFLSPLIVGYLTNNNQTIEQWRLVFIVVFLIMFVTCVLFVLFGTADLQPWNNAGIGEVGEELHKLRSTADGGVLHEVNSEKAEYRNGNSLADSSENPVAKANQSLRL